MRLLLLALFSFVLAGCAPMAVQRPLRPGADFDGPRLLSHAFVSFDGARLGLSSWEPPPDDPPWAVIVGLHGMDDYGNAFHLAGPYWAKLGIATYAYDMRGFGRSPDRGVWGGDALSACSRPLVKVARQPDRSSSLEEPVLASHNKVFGVPPPSMNRKFRIACISSLVCGHRY